MGAWIEIRRLGEIVERYDVAPVWGRGLKCLKIDQVSALLRRPRMGAWIEITGARRTRQLHKVAPVWGRGLKFELKPKADYTDKSPPYGGVD